MWRAVRTTLALILNLGPFLFELLTLGIFSRRPRFFLRRFLLIYIFILGAQAKAKKPLFVQLILDNIWALYEAVGGGRDREKVEKIVASLNLKVSNRDLRSTDPKQQLTAIFSQWLPMAPALLTMVCKKLPAPTVLTGERAEKLMCSRLATFNSHLQKCHRCTSLHLRLPYLMLRRLTRTVPGLFLTDVAPDKHRL